MYVWKAYVYPDGVSWYPEACNSLGLKHILHSPFEKSIIERSMKYVKDRTEGFDDCYPYMKKKDFYCSVSHVHKWMALFIFMYKIITKSDIRYSKINNWLVGDLSI